MYDRYLIQPGEDINSIAKKFNIDEFTLMDINNISDRKSFIEGREIIVPKNKDKYFSYYKIEKGDTLYAIGRKYNINPKLLALLNGLNMNDYIYPDEEILIPKDNYSYYVTAEGDTISTVANKFKTSVSDMVDNNETIYLLPEQLLVKKN